MKFILLLIISFSVFADLEVVKPDYSNKKLTLKIVRAYPSSWETFTLVNSNSRHMTLVCANNRIYDNNKLAYIEYRNFFNEKAGEFTIESNQVCLEMGKFIEAGHMGIDEETPFLIELSRRGNSVSKITYPKIDIFSDTGELKDLLPKDVIKVKYSDKEVSKPKKRLITKPLE